MRCRIEPIPAVVSSGVICDECVAGSIIAIESYPTSVPTFTWRSDSGHLYAYLPPHVFSEGSTLEDCVDVKCPDAAIHVSDLRLSGGGGYGSVSGVEFAWDRYFFSVDWFNGNQLVHLVRSVDGSLRFVRNSKFQVGGTRLSLPTWWKLRSEWTIGP